MLFFCLFQCFEEKEYQTESKRNETFGSVIFGTNVIQRTWSGSQATIEAATRVEGAPPTRHAPLSHGPLGRPPTYFFLLYIPMYHQGSQRKPNFTAVTFYIREIPSWSLRRCSVGGGIDHGGHLHHLQGLSDEL